MDQVTSPTNIPSDPIVQSSAMNSVMQQARNLAARSGLNFDMMPQEMKNQFINAVMPLSNAPTAGV
jgi:aspartokinase